MVVSSIGWVSLRVFRILGGRRRSKHHPLRIYPLSTSSAPMIRVSDIPARPMPYRLAPRRYVKRGSCLARISEDGRRSTVLLGWPDPADSAAIDPEGTGFFIGHEGVPYLVTARHVAETVDRGPFAVRINADDGRGMVEEVHGVEWHCHPDPAVDIAVAVYQPADESLFTCLPSHDFATAEKVKVWDIGPGDAVYVVGLFHLHIGKKRNLPVVHAGNIALLPS